MSRCFPTVEKSLRCLPSWQLIIHFINHFIYQATYHLSPIAKRGVCYTKWAESCHNGKYYDHFSTIEKLLCGQCLRHAKNSRKTDNLAYTLSTRKVAQYRSGTMTFASPFFCLFDDREHPVPCRDTDVSRSLTGIPTVTIGG